MNCSSQKYRKNPNVKYHTLIIMLLLIVSAQLSESSSQTLNFPYFDKLPSEQGWTYLTNVNNGIHTIMDSVLVQNSIGIENGYGFYKLNYGTVIIPEAYWSVDVRAKVNEVGANNSGFFFNVVQNKLLYSVRLTPTEIYLVNENEEQYVIIENDNTIYHDFTLKGIPNAGMIFLIDGVERAEAFPSSIDYDISYDLAFGDGSERSNSNASGEWASYKFSQYTINPFITMVNDVPNDQGGWVNIKFTKSIYDTDSLIVQKISSPELYTIEIDDGSGWTAAASTVGYGKAIYSVLVPTTRDSSQESDGNINFRVVAGMEEGNYLSNIVTGYSKDNISPTVPSNFYGYLTPNSEVNLSWSPNNEKDLSYYNILRSKTGLSFEPIAETVDTSYLDLNVDINEKYFYAIEAIDYSGNKSILSQVVEFTITSTDLIESIPQSYYLNQNYPNPFNPNTRIKYGIEKQGNVKIIVYDILGNKVKELVNAEMSSGEYEIRWNGVNESEQLVTSGIYYYSLTTNGFVSTKKMLLLK